MVLCFIIGFIVGDFFGIVRQEEKKIIKTLQDIIDVQNEIIKKYEDEILN